VGAAVLVEMSERPRRHQPQTLMSRHTVSPGPAVSAVPAALAELRRPRGPLDMSSRILGISCQRPVYVVIGRS
jgi:hypothetical protein